MIDACEDCKEQKMAEFHTSVLERHDRAIDILEQMSTASTLADLETGSA